MLIMDTWKKNNPQHKHKTISTNTNNLFYSKIN